MKSGQKNIIKDPLVDRKIDHFTVTAHQTWTNEAIFHSKRSFLEIALETVLNSFAQPFLAFAIKRKKVSLKKYLIGLRSERCSRFAMTVG